MMTVEGQLFNTETGDSVRFMIDPTGGSWHQWGASTEAMGLTRDYVDAMAHGLSAGTGYFQQEAPEAQDSPAAPEAPTTEEATREALLDDLASQFAHALYAKPLGDLLARELDICEGMASEHLSKHPELLESAPEPAETEAAMQAPAPDEHAEHGALHALATLYAARDGKRFATGCTRAEVKRYAQLASEALAVLIPGK